jgi:hypothetical protein
LLCKELAKKGVLLYSHSKGNTPKTKNQKTFEKTKCLQRSCKEGCVKIRSQQRKTTKKEEIKNGYLHWNGSSSRRTCDRSLRSLIKDQSNRNEENENAYDRRRYMCSGSTDTRIFVKVK